MNWLKKIDKNIFIFLGLSVLILWQMLLPGYVLTLDMVFAPKLKFFWENSLFLNSLPLVFLLKFLNIFLVGWLVQKIVLLALFFSIGYLCYKFLPVSDMGKARYLAAFFYTINPFVYERMLAGQWTHLFAYAFLPVLVYFLLKIMKDTNWQNYFWLFSTLFIINFFSLHLFVMSVLVVSSYFVIKWLLNYKNYRENKKLIKYFVVSAVILVVMSSYWLYPFIMKSKVNFDSYNEANWQAFETASDSVLGIVGNVAALYGFWGENYPWAEYFLWPKDYFVFWPAIFLIFLFIFSGVYYSYKNEKEKWFFFFFLAVISLIFSCGQGSIIFRDINLLLFDNISFWRGFRDTEKWSAFLALAYSFFIGSGYIFLVEKISLKTKMIKNYSVFFLILPFLYTFTIPGGFARQLQSVWYPASWHEVNAMMNRADDDSKVLFLPWHSYLSLEFNNKIISTNPARYFFDKTIIQSQNPEIGEVYSAVNNINISKISRMIEKNSNVELINYLWDNNIKYIILTNDIKDDSLFYQFLGLPNIKKLYSEENLILYKIMLR